MGSGASKLSISDALQKLRQNQLPIEQDEQTSFWTQFWPDNQLLDPFELSAQLTPAELRHLRQQRPQHLAQLVLQCCHQLIRHSRHGLCNASAQQTVVINCARLLVRLLPFAYEDEDLAPLLWTHSSQETSNEEHVAPLAVQLLDAVCDLLFCPDFTVAPNSTSSRHQQQTGRGRTRSTEPDTPPSELCEIDSCEYIWRSGVGFNAPGDCGSGGILGLLDHSASTQTQYEIHRADLLRLLLVLFSETMYEEPVEAAKRLNPCVAHFTSHKNRHCLALFTSLLNTALGYEPASGKYFSFMTSSSGSNVSSSGGFLSRTEQLVELSLQVLIVCLDQQDTGESQGQSSTLSGSPLLSRCESIDSNENVRNPHCANQVCNSDNNLNEKVGFYADSSGPPTPGSVHSFCSSTNGHHSSDRASDSPTNLFVNYLARIHRDEDLQFILNGFVKLLGQPLASTYLPSAARRLQFHQELLILFWRFCDLNKKFLYHTLKSSQVLEVLVPILYHLNESKSDPGRLGLVHIGVFIILLLSGERNFGVRLNKPFRGSAIVFRQLPIFSGSHADLLIVVFHRLITAGSAKLQSLFECLLTILVNVSPYLKTLSMVSAHKMLHFFEAFSTPWFLYCNETNHHLVFYLLEIFNNIVQYQFDGNANLIYTLIRKRYCFHQLANLPTDGRFIHQSLGGRSKKSTLSKSQSMNADSNGSTWNNETNSPDSKNSLPTSPQDDKQTLFDLPSESHDKQKSKIKSEQQHSQSSRTRKSMESTSETNHQWQPQPEWVASWKQKLPLQTIMRMLQVLVPQVEKMCLDKGITDENEILKFLENGTLVGLLPVPHPILIRKYQTNSGTSLWFRTYLWGVIYLRNTNSISPPIWYDTNVRLFEIQKL